MSEKVAHQIHVAPLPDRSLEQMAIDAFNLHMQWGCTAPRSNPRTAFLLGVQTPWYFESAATSLDQDVVPRPRGDLTSEDSLFGLFPEASEHLVDLWNEDLRWSGSRS